MRCIILFCCLLFSVSLAAQTGRDSTLQVLSPRKLTFRFIADYEKWNDAAQRLSQRKNKKADSLISDGYAKLVQTYCRPNQTYDGPSYGTVSFHARKHEKIRGEKIRKEGTVVSTVYTDPVTGHRSRYEYIFRNGQGRWYLEEIFLVDKEGRYPTFNFKPKQ